MGSHSVTFHPTQVNTLTPARQTGTRFTYSGGIEGWVDLGERVDYAGTIVAIVHIMRAAGTVRGSK